MNRLSVLHYFGLILLLPCLLWKGANGQGRKPIEPPPPFRVAHRSRPTDYQCFPKHHYSLEARLKVYPFSKASKVAIASFRTPESVLFPADSLDMRNYSYDYGTVPDGKDSLQQSRIEEIKILDSAQLDKLTGLLYNYDYRRNPVIAPYRVMSSCYAPHNAILFYNGKEEIFAFMELCFTCEGSRESDDDVDPGAPCEGKYQLLLSFFRENNIIIGISQIPLVELFDGPLK